MESFQGRGQRSHRQSRGGASGNCDAQEDPQGLAQGPEYMVMSIREM